MTNEMKAQNALTEPQDLTFNADNWTGKTITISYASDGDNYRFEMYGYRFDLIGHSEIVHYAQDDEHRFTSYRVLCDGSGNDMTIIEEHSGGGWFCEHMGVSREAGHPVECAAKMIAMCY